MILYDSHKRGKCLSFGNSFRTFIWGVGSNPVTYMLCLCTKVYRSYVLVHSLKMVDLHSDIGTLGLDWDGPCGEFPSGLLGTLLQSRRCGGGNLKRISAPKRGFLGYPVFVGEKHPTSGCMVETC